VLQQIDEKVLAEDAHLFDLAPHTPVHTSGWGNYDFYGDRFPSTPNEPAGIVVSYYLRDAGERKVTVRVADLSNQLLRTLPGTSRQGLNTVRWDVRDTSGKAQPAGEYLVTLEIDGRKFAKTAHILAPPK
jgi:hypothetical protein